MFKSMKVLGIMILFVLMCVVFFAMLSIARATIPAEGPAGILFPSLIDGTAITTMQPQPSIIEGPVTAIVEDPLGWTRHLWTLLVLCPKDQ
jgi:hypothetical protein